MLPEVCAGNQPGDWSTCGKAGAGPKSKVQQTIAGCGLIVGAKMQPLHIGSNNTYSAKYGATNASRWGVSARAVLRTIARLQYFAYVSPRRPA